LANELSFEEKFDRLFEDIHVMRKTVEKWEHWDKTHHEKYVEGKGDGGKQQEKTKNDFLNPNLNF